jgi:cobalt-zinc-cadmium efflux system outer membrane protein
MLICAICAAGPIAVPAATLDEATAVQLGLARPAVGSLVGGQIDAARGEARAAGAWRNPEFEYERESSNLSGGEVVENSYRLSQVFGISGTRSLREQAAQRRVNAAALEGDSYRRELAAEIRRVFFLVLRGDGLDLAARRWSERLTTIDETIRRREAAGEASRYDRQRILQERLAVPAIAAEARAQRDSAWQRLSVMIGRDEAARFSGVEGRLLPALPAPLEEVLAKLEDRPELKALAERAQASSVEVRAAERSNIPDVKLGIGLKTVEERSNDDTRLLLSTSIPLPIINRAQGEILRAGANARVARAQYDIALDRARGDVAAAWHRVRALHRAASEYRRDAQEPTEQLTRVAEAAYRAGETGILELVDAYRTAFEVQRRTLDLEMEVRLGRIELDRMVGSDSP